MERTITVVGRGESAAPPDQCQLDFRVGATAPTVAEATNQMSIAGRAVLDALSAAGADEVSTARFTIRVHHDHQGQPSGYRAETSIRAETTRLDSGEVASQLLGAAVEAGGDHLSLDGMEFVHSDPSGIEHEASRAAIADARSRAEVMATAASASLGEVLMIDQQVTHGPGPIRFKAMAASAADVPVQPGSKSATVELRVTFALT